MVAGNVFTRYTSAMKSIILSFIFSVAFFSLYSAETPSVLANIKDPAALIDNEIARLDSLILATRQSLEGQQKLREKIIEYKKIEEFYLKQPDDNEILFRLVKSAHRTLEAIKENHLLQTFDPEFIDELTVLSQAATKRGIPKP